MSQWWNSLLEQSNYFMPHGHCYLWIPSLLWLHVVSDMLVGTAYIGISLILYLLVRKIRLPFSPVFIAFGLFIGLCGITHFMNVWTVWNPDYLADGLVKAATAAASVATAVGLLFVRPQVEEVVHAARLSEERRTRLESANAELEALYKKVKELDELKSQFFANVSHELRTPLTLILGPAERMLGDDNLTADQKRQLESIGRNGKMLLKQVNDLLDISKLEAGKMQVQYVRLDLSPWLRRIASQFEIAAEQRQFRFQVDVPNTLVAEIDPDMLERVFINLLSNAFKFTPQGGNIQVSMASSAQAFSFSVTDTGPGISADQHQAIFERFRQADGGATRKYGGTGLGLAIVKDFVDLHDGRIEVESAPGGGAKFTVTLPLSAPAGAQVRAAPDALGPMTEVALESALIELTPQPGGETSGELLPPSINRASILVAEDSRDMSSFIAGILRSEYQVVTAADGQEGLERALALQPDLIITDIMMPRMSGDQLVAEVRKRKEFDAIPILLLTAKDDDELRVKLLQTGAQDYLSKPFHPQELLARAGNLIAMKRIGDTLRTELASASSDLEGLAKEIAIKRRQLQTALDGAEIAREQAEQASLVKTNFLGLVSHELRTPLSTIHMNSELLSAQQDFELPESFRMRIRRLTRATRQMATLIDGLLEYTRIESGKIIASRENVDAIAVAREIVEAQKENVPPGVRLDFVSPDKLPPLVSDGRFLRIILDNLVSNALKFTSHGTVTLQLSSDETGHIFEVHDTGIGISEADIARIFLPFERLEPVQRKSIPGVGLGLSLVKQIAEAIGGKVEVKSQAGTGSTFRIRLFSQS